MWRRQNKVGGIQMLRHDFTNMAISEDEQKSRAFNLLRHEFSKETLKRFHEVKDSIENVWDLVANKAALSERLSTIASKDPMTWTDNNLKDMALICCILWNDDTE